MMNNETQTQYLKLLSRSFPTIADASKEIINLKAILNLPKGTEHFLADIHGESEAFQHILKNASGNIKRKVNELFGKSISDAEKKELCMLIYYPEKKLQLIKSSGCDIDNCYHVTIHQLVNVCKDVSSKYTRSKVRKNLPKDFSYIIEELLHERSDDYNKGAYVNVIVDTIITTGRADDFIIALCNVIQRLAIDTLHILGDIYDRGHGAHYVMDTLRDYHSWDIQWGNHDILWMGASAGNKACICNVLRLSLRYANLDTLEEYGINLVPLATFAMEVYGDDPCVEFIPKLQGGETMDEKTKLLTARMHKAISILQFKEEARIFNRREEWQMTDRSMLNTIDYNRGICIIDGNEYPMTSCSFPTVDAENPNELTAEETILMDKLLHSFAVSERLRKHVNALLSHGCMYAIYNSNLLFHASIPLNEDGTLKEITLNDDKKYSGRELMHRIGMIIRSAFEQDATEKEREFAKDYFLYLWCGKDSPLFDKSKMATFERYFLTDKSIFVEEKGAYFRLRNDEEICDKILDAFGVEGENRHIINGHVPVHASRGENPIKANGKLMVIDGGFSEPYHKETGIAGYTLVYHSKGFELVQHEPFTNAAEAIATGSDIKSRTQIVEMSGRRLLVADTDKGREIRQQIEQLQLLLYAYRHGIIKEKEKRD
ncbi:MAG: fructose-1,6-bisphosphatase [Prevotella sp.]|nr:fructose-1,6-bisphosphatase [Prevotella sp.]